MRVFIGRHIRQKNHLDPGGHSLQKDQEYDLLQWETCGKSSFSLTPSCQKCTKVTFQVFSDSVFCVGGGALREASSPISSQRLTSGSSFHVSFGETSMQLMAATQDTVFINKGRHWKHFWARDVHPQNHLHRYHERVDGFSSFSSQRRRGLPERHSSS